MTVLIARGGRAGAGEGIDLRLCPIPRPRPNQRVLANDDPVSAALALPRAKASA
jgi:hypothetical protein